MRPPAARPRASPDKRKAYNTKARGCFRDFVCFAVPSASKQSMKRLRVELGDRSYPVLIGANLLARSGRILASLGLDTAPVVVTNARILGLHGRALLEPLEAVFGCVPVVRIGDGERFKNQATLAKIYEGLCRAHANRRSWILAFGGGVVGDIAGFAAATFMRGIRWVVVPTTLLSQADSSVGGKVGINLARGKNLVGAIHQPTAVLSDTATLQTLPAREFAAGLYEIVKCGAIRSEPLLRYLESRLDDILMRKSSAIAHAVSEAVRIKAEVVARDERETGIRATLNYGHSIGHALEAATDYGRFKHGEAVAWGMVAAAKLGCAVAGLPGKEAERLVRLIHRIERLPSLRGITTARVWGALQHDKKSHGGKIRMVVLPRLGRTEIVDNLDPMPLRRFVADFLSEQSAMRRWRTRAHENATPFQPRGRRGCAEWR
jgi:3-dehydroquinate synthase